MTHLVLAFSTHDHAFLWEGMVGEFPQGACECGALCWVVPEGALDERDVEEMAERLRTVAAEVTVTKEEA